jgi:hypothetical protein
VSAPAPGTVKVYAKKRIPPGHFVAWKGDLLLAFGQIGGGGFPELCDRLWLSPADFADFMKHEAERDRPVDIVTKKRGD